jgi:hypothetical protein
MPGDKTHLLKLIGILKEVQHKTNNMWSSKLSAGSGLGLGQNLILSLLAERVGPESLSEKDQETFSHFVQIFIDRWESLDKALTPEQKLHKLATLFAEQLSLALQMSKLSRPLIVAVESVSTQFLEQCRFVGSAKPLSQPSKKHHNNKSFVFIHQLLESQECIPLYLKHAEALQEGKGYDDIEAHRIRTLDNALEAVNKIERWGFGEPSVVLQEFIEDYIKHPTIQEQEKSKNSEVEYLRHLFSIVNASLPLSKQAILSCLHRWAEEWYLVTA